MALWTALALGWVTSPYAADIYAIHDRAERFESAWQASSSVSARKAAANYYRTASTSTLPEAARLLDMGIAALENRKLSVSDAITVRIRNPFCEPGDGVTVDVSWAYFPGASQPIIVNCCGTRVQVKPGESGSFDANPYEAIPELRQNPEVGLLVPITVDGDSRASYVSFVRNYAARSQTLAKSTNLFVRQTSSFLLESIAKPGKLNQDLPLISTLFTAEAMDDGRAKLSDFESLLRVRSNGSVLRVRMPRWARAQTGREINVVVGNDVDVSHMPNAFFDPSGFDRASAGAIKRGWAFIGASGKSGVIDAVQWLTAERKLKPKNLFVIRKGSQPFDMASVQGLGVRAATWVNSSSGSLTSYIGTAQQSPVTPSTYIGNLAVRDHLSTIFTHFEKVAR